MKYIIQHQVVYDPDARTLHSGHEQERVITLTRTASSLLTVLLENQGVISRDDLLARVWESQGSEGSFNNLSQYLSILRRAFRSCGLDEVILTLPRQGIQVHPDISIIRNTANLSPLIAEPARSEPPEPDNPTPSPAASSMRLSVGFGRFGQWIMLSLACITGLIFLLLSMPVRPTVTRLYDVPVPGCHVRSPEAIREAYYPQLVADFNIIRERLKLTCDDSKTFLVYYGSRLKTDGLGKTLLVQCAARGNNSQGECENYYFSTWR